MYGKSRLQSSQLMARARVISEKDEANQETDGSLKRARAALRANLVTLNSKKKR